MVPRLDTTRTVLSQVVDWFLVFIVAGVSLALITVNPDSHDFSIADLSLSYEHRADPKVPLWLLLVLAVLLPAGIVLVASIQSKASSTKQQRQAFNNDLLGLGISLASATVIMNIKNLAGKPRPDFLNVCQPDVVNIGDHKVGGYGSGINVIVSRSICRQTDHALLNDGFRSFPSGYSLIAFAGLCHTSMWLCHRFSLPLFVMRNLEGSRRRLNASEDEVEPLLERNEADFSTEPGETNHSTSLPLHYMILPYTLIGLAVFIAGTRYFDFRNHGIDVIAGAAGGIFSAWIGINWTQRSRAFHQAHV